MSCEVCKAKETKMRMSAFAPYFMDGISLCDKCFVHGLIPYEKMVKAISNYNSILEIPNDLVPIIQDILAYYNISAWDFMVDVEETRRNNFV